MSIENDVLSRINSVVNDNTEAFLNDICISLKGAEILFLAQYIERLEEKELILNALLGKDKNIIVNNQINK